MPMRYVEPECFASTGRTEDLQIYHCYKDGMVMAHWYQIRDESSDTGWTAFDIRSLMRECWKTWYAGSHKALINIACKEMSIADWIQSGRIETMEGSG